jgi:PIN domain nuclease of toxin-antitoxin system
VTAADLLLDTHALLWWLAGDPRLPSRAQHAISDSEGTIFVSAASAWEIATKSRLGKLPGVADLASGFVEIIQSQGFVGLDISIAHAQEAGLLPGPHRDPFDRMLIAQAQLEGLTVLSNDAAFDVYAVPRIW